MIDQASPPKSVSSCAFPPHPSTLVKGANKTAALWCAGRDKKGQRTCLKAAMKSDVKRVCLAVVESDIRCSRVCPAIKQKRVRVCAERTADGTCQTEEAEVQTRTVRWGQPERRTSAAARYSGGHVCRPARSPVGPQPNLRASRTGTNGARAAQEPC